MSNIVLNQSNIVNDRTNSDLVYKFPRSVTFGDDAQIVLSSCSIFYSWFNISSENQNNFFQYRWWGTDPDAGLTEIIDVLIPDGYYTTATLYELLQYTMLKNGHYLALKSSAEIVYFIEIRSNSTYYANEFVLSSLSQGQMSIGGDSPDTAATVFHAPTGWAIPNAYESPEIIIPSNNKFGALLGFSGGTISTSNLSQTLNEQQNIKSSITPQMEPQSSFVITCSLVKNELSSPSNVLASFSVPGSSTIGDQISISPDAVWSKIAPGQYEEIRIQILDQSYKALKIRDPSMLFVLSIK